MTIHSEQHKCLDFVSKDFKTNQHQFITVHKCGAITTFSNIFQYNDTLINTVVSKTENRFKLYSFLW